MDEVQLWNRVRTGAEVAADYKTPAAKDSPGLVGQWHFDVSNGTTTVDTVTGTPATLLGGAKLSTEVPKP